MKEPSGINIPLIEKLKDEYGIDFYDFRKGLPYDAHGMDIQKIIDIFKNVIAKVHEDWEVTSSTYIERFSQKYSKFEDWKVKLLNLADNNYDLLNFKESNKKAIKLLVPEDSSLEYIATIEDELSRDKTLSLAYETEKEIILSDKIHKKLNNKILLVDTKEKTMKIDY